MPIRTRLGLLFTLGAIVLMAVVTGVFLFALNAGLTSNLDATLRTRAADAAAALQADPAAMVTTETSSGILVQILTDSGRLSDGSDVLGNRPVITSAQAGQAAARPRSFDVTVGASSDATQDEGRLRAVAVPGPRGTVVLAAISRVSVDDAVRRALFELLLLDGVLIAAAAAGSWLLARAALRPVESMRRQAAALSHVDAATGIQMPTTRDELAHLASTFNDLLGRLASAVERERAFVADAGHELRTPLTVLKGELELAQRPGRSAADMRTLVAVAADETERLITLSEDLLGLVTASADTEHFEDVDVARVARTASAALTTETAGREITIDPPEPEAVLAWAQPESLRRAIENVVANALRYAPPETEVHIHVDADDRCARVCVRDTGPGFPDAFIPRAFERFSRADATRHRQMADTAPHGTGLGLAIVHAVMTQHHGTATARNDPEGGAVVELTWPSRRAGPTTREQRAP